MKGQNAVLNTTLSTRRIAVVGVLSAVSIVLGLTGYGFVPLPLVRATTMHIPVIIGAIAEGPVVGALIGLIFGLSSFYQNATAPTSLLSPFFLNPVVSVLPRMLIGITAYYGYRLIPARLGYGKLLSGGINALKIGVGAAIGSLTNTVGVLSLIYFIYANKLAEALNSNIDQAAAKLLAIGTANGIPEAVLAVIVAVPVVLAVKKLKDTES